VAPDTAAAAAVPAAAETERSESDVSEALRSFVSAPVADRLVEAGGRLPEERRLITALFADVSGFTSLSERLGDPEDLLEVIDPVITALSDVVGRYEGYVEKFAGDALLALFGAPVSHGDDADRALLVALEMHRELARVCAELPQRPELTLHVGVNSGHGIARILGSEARMDYGVLGDSVILAQRLESAAPPGETYVSEVTVELTRERFEFEPVGALTLKGKSEPVSAWRLLGVRKVAAQSRRPMIGREEELAAVVEALAAAREGRGGVITVTGEPGVGKSRLTEEARARAEADGMGWLLARCLSYGAGLAYWPYAELLRAAAGLVVSDSLVEAGHKLRSAFGHLPSALPYFERLLGLPAASDAADVVSLEPEAFRRGLHGAFRAWLSTVATAGPIVVAIEDVHWADASTLELTRELADVTDHVPLVLYLIARPEAEAPMAELAVSRTAIRLEPLDEARVEVLVEALLEGSAPQGLVPFVAKRTAGNPYFVGEMVRALLDSEDLFREDGVWRMRRGWDVRRLPATIEEVLSARFDLLPRTAGTVLQTAAVIGRRVPLPLLRAVADDADLSSSLERLTSAGFLDRIDDDGNETFLFHHALVQDVAYSRLLRRQQRQLHRRVADAAEELYGAGEDVIDLLARHRYLGAAPDAVDYLLRAADRAKRLFANEEAILHLGRAVELTPDDFEIKLTLAEIHDLVGEFEEASSLYDAVRQATNDPRAWAGTAATLRKQGDYVGAIGVVDDAFAAAEPGADLVPLWRESGWALSLSGRYEQAIDVFQAAIEAAGARKDSAVAQLLIQLGRAEAAVSRFEQALEHGLEAQRICEETDDVRTLVIALRMVGSAHWFLDRLDEGADALRRGLELAERVGNAEEIAACLVNLALIEKKRGDLDQAIELELRAIEQCARIGHETGRAQAYANLADSLERSGRLDEAEEYCRKAQSLAGSIGYPLAVADSTNTMATIELKRSNFAQAGAMAEQAVELFLEVGASHQAKTTLELAAEAWEAAGDHARARDCSSRAQAIGST
jgi:class 3 adenylate cyclase/tetratricopeptide (TPR) repeat protein